MGGTRATTGPGAGAGERFQLSWAADEDRRRHEGVLLWWVVTGACAGAALVDDGLLMLPMLPVGVGLLVLSCAWVADRSRVVRSRVAGHPAVRADLPWRQAVDRPLPEGWPEPLVAGTLHRTEDRWTWRPSPLLAAETPEQSWRREDVAAVVVEPLWGPLFPSRGELRLHLRSGQVVRFLASRPEAVQVGAVTHEPRRRTDH